MRQQAQTQKPSAGGDSGFGLLLGSIIGPAFDGAVADVWQAAEVASEVYTDRYQAGQQKKPIQLGHKNSLAPMFAPKAAGIEMEQVIKFDPAAMYYTKLAALQHNRKHAPRMAA